MRVKSDIEFLTKREKKNYYLQQHLACIVINFNNIAFALIQESGENKNNDMYRCMFRTTECILNSLTLCTSCIQMFPWQRPLLMVAFYREHLNKQKKPKLHKHYKENRH